MGGYDVVGLVVDGSTMEKANALAFVFAFALIGAVCLFSPRKVQAVAIKSTRLGFISNFIRKDGYVLMVRMIGGLALLASLVVSWIFFWG